MQSCLGGLPLGSFLMLEQEEKLHKWYDWVSPLWCWYLFQSLSSGCCDGSCLSCSSTKGGQPCRSCGGSHSASGYFVMHQYAWNKHSFRLLYFLTSAEKRARKRWITATRCGIPSFCFGKGSAEGSQKAREKEWGHFLCFWFKACSLPAWFHLVPVGVSLDQSLFWKKGWEGCAENSLTREGPASRGNCSTTHCEEWSLAGDPHCREVWGGDIFC